MSLDLMILLLMHHRMLLAFAAARPTVASVQLAVSQGPQGLFYRAAVQAGSDQLGWLLGIIPSQCKT